MLDRVGSVETVIEYTFVEKSGQEKRRCRHTKRVSRSTIYPSALDADRPVRKLKRQTDENGNKGDSVAANISK